MQVAGVCRDLDVVRTDETAGPAQDLDALAEQLTCHRGGQFLLDLANASAEQVEIHLGRQRLQAADVGPFGEGDETPGGDHRLGGHAVPEIGGATYHVPLDEGHLRAEPGGGRRGLYTGRPAADHDKTHGHRPRTLPARPAGLANR